MTTKDTFFTENYKGYWIHSNYDRGLMKFVFSIQTPEGKQIPAGSVHGAKCVIGRMLSSKRKNKKRKWRNYGSGKTVPAGDA